MHDQDPHPMYNLAETIASTINIVSNDTTTGHVNFCRGMEHQHRTNQQSFTRLCVAWLEHCGSTAYRYDGRNEASHDIGLLFIERVSHEASLPFI